MSTSDWITIAVGLGGWLAAIIAVFSLVYQKRSLRRVKEENIEQLTKEILYITLYYAIDPGKREYIPNERSIDLTKPWIANVHQQVKQRLMREM